jgi:(p)ppGpp synthase/HD superfamily hydrolase
MLTDRYKGAILFAAALHDGQLRKGSEVAYLSHLLSVSALVMEHGGDEQEAIAALLHDAIEDRGDDYLSEFLVEPRRGRDALRRDLELRYGARVRAIVEACTDDEDFAKPPPGEAGSVEAWRARKQHHIERLAAPQDPGVWRVACADKLHNARTILLDYEEHGEALWARFRSRSRENQLWYFESMAALFVRHAAERRDAGLARLAAELRAVAARIRALGAERSAQERAR